MSLPEVDLVAVRPERQPLDALFRPRGVVVVGASSDPEKLGGSMATSLRHGSVLFALVNARGGDGMYRSIADAVSGFEGSLDLAILCVPASACPGVLVDAGASGIGAALVCAGGFAEVGDDGVQLQAELLAAARGAGVRLLGPNTSGFFAPGSGVLASFVPGVAELRAGAVGVVAASGGLNHALAFALDRAGAGVSLGVGIGAGVDVAAPEVLDHLASDETTSAIALHLENVADGDALLDAVGRAVRRKPVVAMVVGRNDVGEFASSHTGALATSWRTTRALLRQAGAVVVDDVDSLVTAASVLARVRLAAHPGAGAGLVTAQAGPGLVVADALHTAGVAVPALSRATRDALRSLLPPMTYQANPVDTGRPGPAHGRIISAVAEDEAVDLVAVYALAEPVVDLVAAAEPARRAGYAVVVGIDGPTADIVACHERATLTGTPAVTGPEALATAIAALVEDARLRDLVLRGSTKAPRSLQRTIEHRPDGYTEAAAKQMLGEAGLRVPRSRVCRTDQEAAAAFDVVGPRVVVKASDASLLHKSDIGGVVLGVESSEAARAAFGEVTAATSVSEVLVEEMATSGIDLIVAARRDPVFGPVVVVGIGGTATEVYGDVAIARVPAPSAWLATMVDELAAAALLKGYRGVPPVDRAELASVLGVLAGLLIASPTIAEIEINPLRATADGLVALDAVIVVGGASDSLHRRPEGVAR
jgi:acetate---CoA ligase (ADP-forming)